MVKPPTVHAESTPDEAVSDSDADEGSDIKDSPPVETTDSPEATDESKPESESEPPAAAEPPATAPAVVEEAPPPDEEVEDPQVTLKAECGSSKCKHYQSKLDECTTRVTSKKQTSETCEEELFDFIHCVDHCVAKTLFDKLK